MPIVIYYILRDKIVEKWNMHEAAEKVIAKGGSAGVAGVSTEKFNKKYKFNMREIYRQLQNDSYQPKGIYP